MVKLRELSNKQLVAQIEKHEKIYFRLKEEREKRVQKSGSDEGLLTRKELKEKAKQAETNKSDEFQYKEFNETKVKEEQKQEPSEEASSNNPEKTQIFHLKLNDDELNSFEKANKPQEEEKEQDNTQTDASVGVTQLLQLNKDAIEELRQARLEQQRLEKEEREKSGAEEKNKKSS